MFLIKKYLYFVVRDDAIDVRKKRRGCDGELSFPIIPHNNVIFIA